MSKNQYYSVKASMEQNEEIVFNKTGLGLINIHLGYSEAEFTVKECREIIESLKQCIKD